VIWSLPIPAPVQVASSEAREHLDVELEHLAVRRHGVLDPHHELDVQRPEDLPRLRHLGRLEEHRQIEHLDLRLDAIRPHLGGQPLDLIGRVLVDPIGKDWGRTPHIRRGGAAAAARPGAARRRGNESRPASAAETDRRDTARRCRSGQRSSAGLRADPRAALRSPTMA
jgi:hypothetical protein